jgi:hypothetical protein
MGVGVAVELPPLRHFLAVFSVWMGYSLGVALELPPGRGNVSFNPEPTATANAGPNENARYKALDGRAVAVGSGLNKEKIVDFLHFLALA